MIQYHHFIVDARTEAQPKKLLKIVYVKHQFNILKCLHTCIILQRNTQIVTACVLPQSCTRDRTIQPFVLLICSSAELITTPSTTKGQIMRRQRNEIYCIISTATEYVDANRNDSTVNQTQAGNSANLHQKPEDKHGWQQSYLDASN